MAKLENETTSQVDKGSVDRKKDGFLKRSFGKVTSGLGHVAGYIAKGALVYGGIRVAGSVAENVYEAWSGNEIEYHGPFSKEGFGFSFTKGTDNVVQLRETNIVEEQTEQSAGDIELDS